MSDAPERERFSLKRWSSRKHASAREPTAAPDALPGASAAAVPAAATTPDPPSSSAPPAGDASLPPVDSLTFDADFSAFMKPDVDPSLKRAALKKLFSDPRFNVMDGLDVYIDDYSIESPIDAETVRGLVQARYLFDPPKTRVNERGEVEDVPPEPDAPVAPSPQADAPAIADSSAPAPAAETSPAVVPDVPRDPPEEPR